MNNRDFSEIKDWVFFLDIELCGNNITACRSIENAGVIEIKGDTSGLPIEPEIDDTPKTAGTE